MAELTDESAIKIITCSCRVKSEKCPIHLEWYKNENCDNLVRNKKDEAIK